MSIVTGNARNAMQLDVFKIEINDFGHADCAEFDNHLYDSYMKYNRCHIYRHLQTVLTTEIEGMSTIHWLASRYFLNPYSWQRNMKKDIHNHVFYNLNVSCLIVCRSQ